MALTGRDAQGKHIWEVIGEQAYHNLQAHIDTVLSGERVSYEIELPGKDGEKHYFYTIMVPEIDDRGTVKGYISLSNDMTEFRAMEQKIADALEFNQTILESSPLGISTFDSSGQCIFANDAAARITGERRSRSCSRILTTLNIGSNRACWTLPSGCSRPGLLNILRYTF